MRALGRLRSMQGRAEGMYLDTFTAYSSTIAKVDGLDTPTWVSQGTTPGKLAGPSAQSRDTQTRTVTIGTVDRAVVEGGLHIPIGSTRPVIGWEYVLTTVGPYTDPTLEGTRWRVIDVPAKSYATGRRLDVVEVPEEA